MFTERVLRRLMTIIWDFSSQEPVFAIEAEEAEGILGVVLSPGVRFS